MAKENAVIFLLAVKPLSEPAEIIQLLFNMSNASVNT